MEIVMWVTAIIVGANALLGVVLVGHYLREQRQWRDAQGGVTQRAAASPGYLDQWDRFVAAHPDWLADDAVRPPRRW
jgi:hypothetical protein